MYAQELANGWTVVDPDGGRWWPDAAAQAEIAAAPDPARAAVRMCKSSPGRGVWQE